MVGELFAKENVRRLYRFLRSIGAFDPQENQMRLTIRKHRNNKAFLKLMGKESGKQRQS